MDWKAVTLLRKNIKTLSKKIKSHVIENYPNRTKENKKCARDVGFIVQALSSCIQSNNTLAIDHIVKMFYLGGKLQLQTIDVELEMYDILHRDILDMFTNHNIAEESKEIVSCCIEILKTGLKDGPKVTNSQWANRRNYKVYDTSVVIPEYMQEHIETILQDAPMQTSGKSRFSVLKLLPSDLEIKEFLATHYFWNRDLNRHEMAVITAPIIYLALAHTEDNASHFAEDFDEGSWPTKHFHMGMHGGAAIDYVLSQGYDFSFIGCTDDPADEITEQWSKIILERFNYKTNQFWSWPMLAFCIGKGVEKFDGELKYYQTQEGKMLPYHYTGAKPAQKKSNILYY